MNCRQIVTADRAAAEAVTHLRLMLLSMQDKRRRGGVSDAWRGRAGAHVTGGC